MTALYISPAEFLRAFSDPAYPLNFRVFDDKKRGTFRGASLSCKWEELGAMLETLKKHNEAGRGIFFVVNAGGQTDAEICRINAQFVENDTRSFEEQEARIKAFPLEPSLIVRTKKSLHVYWLMRDATVADFRPLQKALVSYFDGDGACVNESRVMRLPGFYHCKGEPVLVECVHFRPDLRYTQAQLAAVLPEAKVQPAPKQLTRKSDRKGLALAMRQCDFLKHCAVDAATLSEHDWYAMITNLAVFDGGPEMIHLLSAKYAGYKRAETEEKIAHFLASGTRPMTCATIAEKGYRCPRHEDGSCPCKAPAAICYQPLDTEALIALLAEQPVAGDPLQDIQTAQAFVRDYLYNVEPGVAEVLITYGVKAHFGFKAPEVRSLTSAYKEARKNYLHSRDAKEAGGGEPLPEWYALGERGNVIFRAGILSEYLKDHIHAFYGAEQYYLYQGGVYRPSGDVEARAIVQSFLLPEFTSLNNIVDAEGQWKLKILKSLGEVNCNPYILNLRNGLYNVMDGTFRPHSPEYFSTVQLACSYSPDAACPRFEQYLSEVLAKDELPLVQEMLGYFLVPVTKAQKSFVIVGAAGSGKTQLLNTINLLLLGRENVSNVEWQQLGDRFKTAELVGKLANIFADLPSRALDDNGIFKALVGEDCLTVERKNKDPFSFQPFSRLLFSCNNLPRNYGDKSEGFYRRLIIIRFRKSVPEEKKDPNLFAAFEAEADGILNFALVGLRRLMENKYRFSETAGTDAELQRYRMENNSVLSFIHEACVLDPEGVVEKTELYNRYREYCKSEGFAPFSAANFTRDLEANYPGLVSKRDKLGRRRVWAGVRLSED